MGLAQGAFPSAISVMVIPWFPLREQGRLCSLIFTGVPVSYYCTIRYTYLFSFIISK